MPTTLSLHLHVGAAGSVEPAPAELGPGQPLRAIEGARATLHTATGEPAVHLTLPAVSLAEQRWITDQLRRKTAGLLAFDRVALHASDTVDDDALLSIALDLHNATRGHVQLATPRALGAELEQIGGLEDLYRSWVNEDPSERTSVAIADEVLAWAANRPNCTARVLDEALLRERGLNLLLAVGRAATASPPRLVIVEYTPDERPPLMLLGKGITFDTGGINIKPYESFVSMMKNDMAGAALAWSLFRGLVENDHPEPLLVVLPTCENAVDAQSMRPGEVVTSYRGKTVRVDHTDAEGRLVLADGLAYAVDQHAPHTVLCFATLTTSALVSYGPYATPVHFADAAWQARLRDASAATGEDLHFFEPRVWHYEANRDKEADLRNTAGLGGHAARAAGSRNAAHFFRHFTDTPLIHFDIFASGWNWAEAPGCGYGATGAPLRTLWHALR